MNINRIICLLHGIACLLLAVALCACTDHALTDPDDHSGITPATGLRFTVPAETNTRITYDGRFSTFEEGDTVGCIIATRPAGSSSDVEFAYAAHAKWHYHSEVLLLDRVYTIGSWNTTWGEPEEYKKEDVGDLQDEDDPNRLIRHLNENNEDGYLKLLKEGVEYAFYFYYPYVDETLLKEDVTAALETYNDAAEGSKPDFYRLPSYPNYATNTDQTFTIDHGSWTATGDLGSSSTKVYDYCNIFTLTGTAIVPGQTTVSSSYPNLAYSWLAYPCFVNHTQQTKEQLNHSDFLWIDCQTLRDGQTRITTETGTAPIPLAFKKKTATIEVISEAKLEDVYFQSEYNGLVRGMQIDLQSGKLTSYDAINETSVQKTNQRYTGRFLPCDLATLTTPVVEEEKGKKFRLTLAPQTAFNCNLVFKINDNNHNQEPHTIALGDRISQLSEGYLYTIRITKNGDYSIVIQDWEFGRIEIVDPDDGLKDE